MRPDAGDAFLRVRPSQLRHRRISRRRSRDRPAAADREVT